MDIDDILHHFRTNPQALEVVHSTRPYLPVLERVADQEMLDTFINHAAIGEWGEINKLLWTHMTEDERDSVSEKALYDARQTIKRMRLGERILKQVLLQVLNYALTNMGEET